MGSWTGRILMGWRVCGRLLVFTFADRRLRVSLSLSSSTGVEMVLTEGGFAARDIKKACKEATVEEVQFRFWKEHF